MVKAGMNGMLIEKACLTPAGNCAFVILTVTLSPVVSRVQSPGCTVNPE